MARDYNDIPQNEIQAYEDNARQVVDEAAKQVYDPVKEAESYTGFDAAIKEMPWYVKQPQRGTTDAEAVVPEIAGSLTDKVAGLLPEHTASTEAQPSRPRKLFKALGRGIMGLMKGGAPVDLENTPTEPTAAAEASTTAKLVKSGEPVGLQPMGSQPEIESQFTAEDNFDRLLLHPDSKLTADHVIASFEITDDWYKKHPGDSNPKGPSA